MPPRRSTSGARPEALFRPPPERQPLAARMRPRNLDEFVGQAPLVGERGPLRRSVARGHLASLLLWGPPGTGKTSLARLLADTVGADFHSVSAVMSGVAEVRATIAEAQERLTMEGRRSVLFIDEIHRFNKAQQDALLPHDEDGTVTLVGATTENPYFEVQFRHGVGMDAETAERRRAGPRMPAKDSLPGVIGTAGSSPVQRSRKRHGGGSSRGPRMILVVQMKPASATPTARTGTTIRFGSPNTLAPSPLTVGGAQNADQTATTTAIAVAVAATANRIRVGQ